MKLTLCECELVGGRYFSGGGTIYKPGVTSPQLNRIAERYTCVHGVESTFKNFPNPYGSSFLDSIYTSVNKLANY